jgi:hypothetical protein
MRLKGLDFAVVAEIKETVTDELKKVKKGNFQKLYDRGKACIYANGAYFKLKKRMCLRFLKKSVLKRLDYTVYIWM